jgi:hypothetical protein
MQCDQTASYDPRTCPRHSSPSRSRWILPYAILRRMSSASPSRAESPQHLLRCTLESAAAPREGRLQVVFQTWI